MDAFELADLVRRRNQSDSLYLEFLRVSSLSVGLYALSAGAADPQQPHTEDEVYYVISGRAYIQVGIESRAVEAGTLVFVNAGVEHRFHTITEDLTLLVCFAPAEYSLDPDRSSYGDKPAEWIARGEWWWVIQGLYLPDAKETWVGEREAGYIISGPYGVYYDVLRGKLGAINHFVELMQGMDIELVGDAAPK